MDSRPDKIQIEYHNYGIDKIVVIDNGKGISLEDLKNYKAKPRTPQTFNYKGYKIVGMGMPSSGGLLMAQMWKGNQ